MEYKLLFFAVAALAFSVDSRDNAVYEGYQVLKVIPQSSTELKILQRLMDTEPELDFWHDPHRIGKKVLFMVPPKLLGEVKNYLSRNKLDVSIFRENVQSLVTEQWEDMMKTRAKRDLKAAAFDYNIYHTYEEIMVEVDDYPNRCPSGFKCEIYSIGQSFEGRDMKMFRVYKDEPNRPVYWVDSLIHAREWLSGAVHLKMMNHMLANYDSDSDVQMMFDKGDWHFLFVHNPDGYAFSWNSGERLWRKNRFNNTLNIPDARCMGVDLNRNYMHRWRNYGASSNPCSITYAGWYPASEIEAKNVQNEVYRLESRLKAFVTLHTAAKMILMPWGSVRDPWAGQVCEYMKESDHTKSLSVATAMSQAIENTHGYHTWQAGTSCGILYAHGGTTQDFVAGVTGVIYSYTPELRDMDAAGNEYVFEAPPSEIDPAFQETWNGFVAMVKEIDEQELGSSGASGIYSAICFILMAVSLTVSFL